ncbi:MAG: DUF1573 domain-containing protein [Phycisphaerae bacterium]|nr:DUF1573 domain-containing protein [Phycisphaerae bacterium]
MRRNMGRALGVAFGLALVSVSGLAMGQDSAPAAQPPVTEPAAKSGTLVFEQDAVDLGTVIQNEVKQARIKFKNTGAFPVKFQNVKKDCGCTEAKIKIDGTDKIGEPAEHDQNTWIEVPAGGSGELEITYDPKGKVGAQSKRITVTTDEAENAVRSIGVTVLVEQNIMLEPTVLNFGSVERGTSKTLRVTVVGRTADFAATDATVTLSELLQIKKVGDREVTRGDKKLRATEFDVTFTAGGKTGRSQDVMNIRTNDAREPMKQLSVTFLVQGLLASEPSILSLSTAKPGEDMKGEFILKHRKDQVFKVTKAETASLAGGPTPEVKYEVEAIEPDANGAAKKWRIKAFTVAPIDRPSLNVNVKITTDVPGEEMIQVRAYGVVRRVQAAADAPAPAPAAVSGGSK